MARVTVDPGKTQPTRAVKLSLDDTRPLRLRGNRASKNPWQRVLQNPEARIGISMIVLFVLVAIFADVLAPYPVRASHLQQSNLPPFWVQRSNLGYAGTTRFLLGTDRTGRDLLTWGMYGTRTSMLLGLVSAPLIGIFGMLVGLLAGYAGGWVDNWIMRVTDVFYAFPTLMIAIMVVFVLRNTPSGLWFGGLFMFFVAFLSVGWAGAARIMRGSVLMVKNTEFIEAARCIGVPAPRLIFRHIMPHCLGPLLVWVTLMVPQLILIEAVFGYLQINAGPAGYSEALLDTSWGGMIRQGRSLIHVQPVTVLIPAFGVGLISIAFTFLGDALRDAFDPQTKDSRGRD